MGSQVTRCLEIQQKPCKKQIQKILFLGGSFMSLRAVDDSPPRKVDQSHESLDLPLAEKWHLEALGRDVAEASPVGLRRPQKNSQPMQRSEDLGKETR